LLKTLGLITPILPRLWVTGNRGSKTLKKHLLIKGKFQGEIFLRLSTSWSCCLKIWKISEELWCSPRSPSCQLRNFRIHGLDRHRV
jgi:hypothetical protein